MNIETAGVQTINANPTMPPLFLADHQALDFINSLVSPKEYTLEFLTDDAAVLRWLEKAGFPTEGGAAAVAENPPNELVTQARALREAFRIAVAARKKGDIADISALNTLLARSNAYSVLYWSDPEQVPERVSRRYVTAPADLLVPVAEAMANLLTTETFTLIRKCENPGCSLWFFDRTKSHKRRWCSMALCGNRMKVAAFRSRQQKQLEQAEASD